MDISKLKVVDLKKELKNRGLSTIGTKNELMERLQDAVHEDETGDNGALDNDDLLDEEAVLAEESDEAILEEGSTNLIVPEDDAALLTPTALITPKVSAEVPAQNSKSEIGTSRKKIILNRKVASSLTSGEESVLQETETPDANSPNKSNETETKEEKKVVKLGSLSAEERAKLRAQKFGVPVPDSLKKAVRAERFGNANSTVAPTGKSQVVDNEKLLKRQARFGVVSNAEIDEKKQKRAERFGANNVGGASSDEQKRKRAERFGLA
ncbi:SAP domain-containing ribonucleoprotein-like [Daphnia carinata]|uniref:SAP domain-containing ribonucleoprotein-like n=1 Tax=Daphnia carinata TaxID=120202 RepID=UPI00257A260F|nr:SAP domain-containing ribonucleoprotein-like [Daphnia carinata]